MRSGTRAERRTVQGRRSLGLHFATHQTSRTRYIIYYECRETEVSIERVLDGRRDVQRILELGMEGEPRAEGETED